MDPLYELLAPYFDPSESPTPYLQRPSTNNNQTANYLNRLSTLSLSDLVSNEPASLLQSGQSHHRNLQALSKRSHKSVISSSTHLSSLTSVLPSLGSQATELQQALPELQNAATAFATKYGRSTEYAVLDRRKRATLLSRNADRISDVLDLPSLLSSTVTAAQTSTVSSSSTTATSFATALDLHGHIRRLSSLYPQSELVGDISKQAEAEIDNLTTILITSLQSQSLKLASAMRVVGLLKRVAPELAADGYTSSKVQAKSTKSFGSSANTANTDGALGSLFLVCRLRTLHSTLDALEPLRDLADQETIRNEQGIHSKLLKQQVSASALGSQSERYLKRYVEIFREQSFSIISMYKSIFPSRVPEPDAPKEEQSSRISNEGSSQPPSPLSSFGGHLIDMLVETLRRYLPNVTDRQARESLLTQVLYCAGSLGRLGADFGMMIALLEEDMSTQHGARIEEGSNELPEWVHVMQKHRIQASRLEVLARGVGSGRKASMEVHSPVVVSPG